MTLWEQLDDAGRERLLLARDQSTAPRCFRCDTRIKMAAAVACIVAEGANVRLPPGSPVLLCKGCAALYSVPETRP